MWNAKRQIQRLVGAGRAERGGRDPEGGNQARALPWPSTMFVNSNLLARMCWGTHLEHRIELGLETRSAVECCSMLERTAIITYITSGSQRTAQAKLAHAYIAFDFQGTRHECLLSIQLSVRQADKRVYGGFSHLPMTALGRSLPSLRFMMTSRVVSARHRIVRC